MALVLVSLRWPSAQPECCCQSSLVIGTAAGPVSGPSGVFYEWILILGSPKTTILGFGEGRIWKEEASSKSLDTHDPSPPASDQMLQAADIPRPNQPVGGTTPPAAEMRRRGRAELGWGRGGREDLDLKCSEPLSCLHYDLATAVLAPSSTFALRATSTLWAGFSLGKWGWRSGESLQKASKGPSQHGV